MKERVSMVFLQKGQIDVKDGAFVEIDKEGVRTNVIKLSSNPLIHFALL